MSEQTPGGPTIGCMNFLSVFDDVGDHVCTEFEIQAFLWAELRALGFRVRGEFGFCDFNQRFRRADLVLFAGREQLGIEVKADGKSCSPQQLESYRDAFLAAMAICGQAHAVKFLETIRHFTVQELENELREAGAKRIARRAKVMNG